MNADERGDGHVVLDLELVGAGLVEAQVVVDGEEEVVQPVLRLRLPSAVTALEVEPVVPGAQRPVGIVEHREHHREVVEGVGVVEGGFEFQVVGNGLVEGDRPLHKIETLPACGGKIP